MQRAEPDRPGGGKAGERSGRRRRDEAVADFCAAARRLAGNVIHVLVRQRHAGERPRLIVERGIGVGRRGQSLLRLDAHEGIGHRLPALDARQQRARGFH
jgi:hypothetical protein